MILSGFDVTLSVLFLVSNLSLYFCATGEANIVG